MSGPSTTPGCFLRLWGMLISTDCIFLVCVKLDRLEGSDSNLLESSPIFFSWHSIDHWQTEISKEQRPLLVNSQFIHVFKVKSTMKLYLLTNENTEHKHLHWSSFYKQIKHFILTDQSNVWSVQLGEEADRWQLSLFHTSDKQGIISLFGWFYFCLFICFFNEIKLARLTTNDYR